MKLERLGIIFETLTDLMIYLQKHYDNFSKEDLVYIISEICEVYE